MKIGFLGMTHLGLIMSCAAAAKGHEVRGMDSDTYFERLYNLQKTEPDFPIKRPFEGWLTFDSNFDHLEQCDLLFISHDVDHQNDINRVEQLISLAHDRVPDTQIVILSQVPIGTTRKWSKVHPKIYYQIDTLRMGHAVERALNPEMITIGVPDVNIGREYIWEAGKYGEYLGSFDCPKKLVLYEQAEIAKSMINVYLAAQVTLTNIGAEVCKKYGVSWEHIIDTFKADRRIGPHAYLEPGPGFAGSHLVRDVERIRGEFPAGSQNPYVLLTELLRCKDGV